eukprot:755860-Hanusia_phi.AAC.2
MEEWARGEKKARRVMWGIRGNTRRTCAVGPVTASQPNQDFVVCSFEKSIAVSLILRIHGVGLGMASGA